MTQPILKTLLFMVITGSFLTSCNNKKDESVNGKNEKVADTKKEKVADADHSFDITLVKGSETIEFSETVPSNEGGALYKDQKMPTGKEGDRSRTIMMSIGKDYRRGEAGIFGNFVVDENFKPLDNIKNGEKKASFLTIRPKAEGDSYTAISGTLTFSDLKYVLPMPRNGAACFKLNFEGDFLKNNKKEDLYKGSGTIVLSPKRDMGVYKKK